MRPVPVLRRAKRPCAWGCAALLLAGATPGAPALALQLPLHLPDIPDVSMHLDGTVHYTLGIRTESPDAAIYRNPQYTEADLEYSKFGLNTARLDFSSSFEAQYQDWAGFRFSGAAWMDNAFSSSLKTPPSDTPAYTSLNYLSMFKLLIPPARQTFPVPYSQLVDYPSNQYNDYAQRWEGGPSAEIRDLFFWGNFALWQVPLNVKLGRFSSYWGESIFDTVDGVSYAQVPIDAEKALRAPGTEAKDLVLPLPQLGITAQLTPALAFGAQYYLGWGATRLPPAGTEFGVPYAITGSDAQLFTGFSFPTDNKGGSVPMFVDYAGYDKPSNNGNFGLYFKYRPQWLWGIDTGLYYRRADETLPWVLLHPVFAVQPTGIVCHQPATDPFPVCASLTASEAFESYQAVYNRHMEIMGLSFEKNWHRMTFGAEVVMRRGTALQTLLAPSPSAAGYGPDTTPTTPPSDLAAGEGARGNTLHALFNVAGTIGPKFFWDAFDWKAEVSWAHLQSVTQNSSIYAGEGYGGCVIGPLAGNPAAFRSTLGTDTVGTQTDGCASSSAIGLRVSLAPSWIGVRRALNLSLPISIGEGLSGNSPVLGGSQAGTGSYSVGLAADYRHRYNFGLAYNDYLSRYRVDSNGIAISNPVNTLGSGLYNDRGWVSMTFQMSF